MSIIPLQPAFAESTKFDTVTIPVKNQGTTGQKEALRQAFNQMLIRITGNTSIITLPSIQRVTPALMQYIRYYRYVSTKESPSNISTLQVVFNIQAINRLLKKAGIAIWPRSERPTPLIWINLNQDKHIQLLSSTLANEITETLFALSKQYALPILLPLMDLKDIRLMPKIIDPQTNTIVADSNALLTIKTRYQTKALLIGSFTATNESLGSWNTGWQLSFMQEIYLWSITGDDLTRIIRQSFQNMINILVNYTLTTEDISRESTLLLHVQGINDLQAYTHISKQLKQINLVKRISLESLSSNAVTFRLTLSNGSTETFISELNQKKQFYFIKKQSMPTKSDKQNIQTLIPNLYYDYGQTTTIEH